MRTRRNMRLRMAVGLGVALFVSASPAGIAVAGAQTPEPGGTATASPEPAPTSSGTSDLSVTLTGPSSTPLAGQAFELTATVTNSGPDPAADSHLIDYVPASLTFFGATSSDPSDSCSFDGTNASGGDAPQQEGGGGTYPERDGGQVDCLLGTLAPSEGATITISVRRESAHEIWNSASAYSLAEDSNFENNYAEIRIEPDTSNPADLAVSVTSPRRPAAGTDFPVRLDVRNAGPSPATDAAVGAYLPAGLQMRSLDTSDPTDTCTGGESSSSDPAGTFHGGEVSCALGTLAAGETATVSIVVTRVRSYEMYLGAWTSASNYDPGDTDNFAEAVLLADESDPSDVSIAVSGPRRADIGASFEYVLKVTNAGPTRARGVTVVDHLPSGVDYTSSSVSGGAGICRLYEPPPPEGEPRPQEGAEPEEYRYREVQCDLGDIRVGDSVAVRIQVVRRDPWELWNYASVAAINFDPNNENDYGQVLTEADPSVTSDLEISVSGPAIPPLLGTRFSYVIRVRNQGPAPADAVTLTSSLPEGVRFEGASSSPAGAQCTYNDYSGESAPGGDVEPVPAGETSSGGSDSGSDPRSYPEYSSKVVDCSLGTVASGGVVEVAIEVTRINAREMWNSVSVYSSNFDPNYDNNYDEILIEADTSNPADLSIELSAAPAPPVGERFAYQLRIQNHGPSRADGVLASNLFPAEVEFESVTSSDASDDCTFSQGFYAQPQDDPEGRIAPDSGESYGGELRCTLGSLTPDEVATITATVVRRSDYEMWNSAWVTGANYDPVSENDVASVLIDGRRRPSQCPRTASAESTEQQSGCGDGSVCGTKESDEIVVDDCGVEAGGGADSVDVAAGSRTGDIKVRAGAGRDVITVNVTAAAAARSRIEIHGGRGPDLIRVVAAPGAGNRTIVVYGDRGNDRLQVDLPGGTTGLRIVGRGGPGSDILRSYSSLGARDGNVSGLAFYGGRGADVAFGGAGADRLAGQAGRDLIDAAAGDDFIDGGRGRDVCRGGPGFDAIRRC